MVRAYKLGSVVVGLAATGLAWGQSALTQPLQAEPAVRIITINEPGKPAQKCRLLKQWTQPTGGKACQVQAIDSGEMMTIVQSGPAPTDAGPDGQSKKLPMRIYHWQGSTPHPQAPMPPLTVETTSIGPMPVIEAKPATIMRTGSAPDGSTPVIQSPMPTGPAIQKATPPITVQRAAPMPTIQPATSPVLLQGAAPTPTIISGSAPMHMPPGPVDRPPGPMTPGGVVLTPAPGGSVRDFRDGSPYGGGGTCDDCCTQCKPSILDRIKACFHKECCPTTCCPESCTTCTPDPCPPAKSQTHHSTGGLFHRSKVIHETVKVETPCVKTENCDPLKDPVKYSNLAGEPIPKPQTTAELAVSPPETCSAKQKCNTRYPPIELPIMPGLSNPPSPPPRAPQPNQALLGNAFGGPAAFAGGPLPVREMAAGNAFGPPPAAMAELQASAFNHNLPNAMGYTPAAYSGIARGGYPPMPLQGAAQPGFFSVPPTQNIAPAGYPPHPGMMMPPAPMAPMSPQSWNLPSDPAHLLSVLRDALLPSQREMAADKLAALDWKTNGAVVQALMQAAKEDPAATVRAGCIHSLVKMNANIMPVIAVCNASKSDTDPRVQHEAAEALAKFAPTQAPMTTDPAVQPAGAFVPAPRSN
jgi:hypothetical protein